MKRRIMKMGEDTVEDVKKMIAVILFSPSENRTHGDIH
jgi:hypothetical protein